MTDASTRFSWVQAIPDGGLVLDRDNKVLAANKLAIDILRVDPTGLLATSFIRAPDFVTTLQQTRNTHSAASTNIYFHGRPQRNVNAWLSPIENAGLVLVVLRDLTREQAIEKMRSDFVANASHEMRTPLTTIMGTIETLQGAAKDDPKARGMFLGTMLSQAHRMKRLIDDLLTLSRIELNEHVRPNTKVSLAGIANQAKSNLSAMAAEYKVEIDLTFNKTVEVFGDADELLQVALNLLENAIKYGGEKGRVEMSCDIRGGDGVLSIRDFGQGIAEDHIPRLTERFYRVNTKLSRARGGTGLGLAIVKHIVLRHAGDLYIQSALGQGSTFTVSIPLYKS
jgi:two-component system, OmpR family, phosphate regulon sensor histidine kinase PhoR